ncbi:hypothetical protein BD324DRAFT_648575 [Kockovaella imperatae]|uniref:FAD-binding domain-containing protein n=1 Tax=Kockovaella imperatae TaxID=4999 RepID=A0A1Y1UPI0_9TREE|nr:hypothetical protein BD324DRAFT_648575 [Kockovaella imperatae]ORX39958.1 hypothetical protein BD324DRAFT_648575 [Kockovaella imperatae]
MPPNHVLIMGAGIGGPALALSLARQGIRATVFEIRPSPQQSGGSITLAANALSALSVCGGQEIYPKVKALGYVYERMGMNDDSGYFYGTLQVGDEKKDGFAAVRIMRTELHKLLLEECKARGVETLFGKKAKEIKQDSKGVNVEFEDGTQVNGDILIGADGIHSQARKHVLLDKAPIPEFSKTIVVNGFVPRSTVITPRPDYEFPATIISPSGFLGAFLVGPKGDKVAWGVNTTVTADKGREGWEEFKRSGEAARLAREDYANIKTEPIRSLLDNMDEKHVQLWVPFRLPILPAWSRGRVGLIGDAAHAMPPNGQGTAMAFEDAAFLGRLLGDEENWAKGPEAIFKHFEKIRAVRLDGVRKMSAKMGENLKKRSDPEGWGWWLKKWAIWAYISVWNRGTIKTNGFMGFDVAKLDAKVSAA